MASEEVLAEGAELGMTVGKATVSVPLAKSPVAMPAASNIVRAEASAVQSRFYAFIRCEIQGGILEAHTTPGPLVEGTAKH